MSSADRPRYRILLWLGDTPEVRRLWGPGYTVEVHLYPGSGMLADGYADETFQYKSDARAAVPRLAEAALWTAFDTTDEARHLGVTNRLLVVPFADRAGRVRWKERR